jgi:RNA polymerase sigma-70 factor (ECF subfamily)
MLCQANVPEAAGLAIEAKRAGMNSPAANNCDAPALPASRPSPQFERDLIALIPPLRTLSRRMCGRRAIAEDVAQEALAKAWRARDRFAPGTNLKAWLFTILRHEYYSHVRRAWRETHWDEDAGEHIAAPPGEQEWAMELSDTARAIGGLQEAQREALILVAVGGFSHEDAGEICAAAEGTMKSRVARARAALTSTLNNCMPIAPRSLARTTDTTEHILAQLTALASREASSARHAPPVSRKA